MRDKLTHHTHLHTHLLPFSTVCVASHLGQGLDQPLGPQIHSSHLYAGGGRGSGPRDVKTGSDKSRDKSRGRNRNRPATTEPNPWRHATAGAAMQSGTSGGAGVHVTWGSVNHTHRNAFVFLLGLFNSCLLNLLRLQGAWISLCWFYFVIK